MSSNASPPFRDHYDCVVLGGGPAGSTAAALIAEAGHSTLLVEREKMPRFHVGESLMPETYWTLQRLGVLEKMKSSPFVKKYSVAFVSAGGKESQPFYFAEHDSRECSQTWQVERANFDKMLFDNAAEKGAECHDETRVLDVLFDGVRATGVRLKTAAGETREVTSRVVVDGTGQSSLIANRLSLKQVDPYLKKAAIWSYFRGAERPEGQHGGATVILHTNSKACWFWYIPLSNDITSVGLVGDPEYLLKSRPSVGDAFCEELSNCPAMSRRLEDSQMVDEFHVAKEFSYTTSQHAGDGWVLVGDAFGFIDPIYSSGVYFALKTGQMAADSIVSGLSQNNLSGEKLGEWTAEFKDGAKWIRQLVDAYYTNEFSFGRFMMAHPEHKGNLTDLLIGRVFYDGAGRIFDDMSPALAEATTASAGDD